MVCCLRSWHRSSCYFWTCSSTRRFSKPRRLVLFLQSCSMQTWIDTHTRAHFQRHKHANACVLEESFMHIEYPLACVGVSVRVSVGVCSSTVGVCWSTRSSIRWRVVEYRWRVLECPFEYPLACLGVSVQVSVGVCSRELHAYRASDVLCRQDCVLPGGCVTRRVCSQECVKPGVCIARRVCSQEGV